MDRVRYGGWWSTSTRWIADAKLAVRLVARPPRGLSSEQRAAMRDRVTSDPRVQRMVEEFLHDEPGYRRQPAATDAVRSPAERAG